jgi:predicted TIM-barrel fold metal-dependent hydrolase
MLRPVEPVTEIGDRGPLEHMPVALSLVDHHVHGALRAAPADRRAFEGWLTEAPGAPSAASAFDSQVGFAVRRWCAPLLGLEPRASAEDYWTARSELGEEEVNRRLLAATGVRTYLVDTGYLAEELQSPAELGASASADARVVVRLESLAEAVLLETWSPRGFVDAFPAALEEATHDAVGTKSVLAYRAGFAVDAGRPREGEVLSAVDRVLRDGTDGIRVTDPVLLRHLLWCGVDRGLPLQLHCGYGDRDLNLHTANPVLLTEWLRATEPVGTPVMLLHNYPYHREAGYLAEVFDHVHLDVGLGVTHVGAQSQQLIAESLEVAPFHKLLYSSDACGPSELHLLGAMLWRRGMGRVLGRFVADEDWSLRDAERVLHLVGHENAERVYGV